MKSSVWVTALVLLVASGLFITNIEVHAQTPFNGIITSNTAWTKANSPYVLQGPVAIDKGVTLTIEPGVTVNLNSHYIKVNGTLFARGTDNEKIVFTGGWVTFTSVSQQTGQASVLENTVADGYAVWTSMTVTKNVLKTLEVGGSSTVSQNTIESLIASESATVTNNEITQTCSVGGSAKLQSNNIYARVVAGGNAEIFNNKIGDGVHIDSLGGSVKITGNQIHTKNTWSRIHVSGSHADISNNVIIGDSSNKPMGISVSGVFASASITGNQIYNCQTGISIGGCNAKISKNVIAYCDLGVTFSLWTPILSASAPWNTPTKVEVTSNTISRNTIGIQTSDYDGNATVSGNSIYENTQYNFKLVQTPKDVVASNNYWGTTDTSAIRQKIYDYQMDFYLGHVITDPVLTSPASGAPAIPANIPSDTSQPTMDPTSNPTETTPPAHATQNPTATHRPPDTGILSDLNVVEVATLAVLIVIAALLAVLVSTLKRRR